MNLEQIPLNTFGSLLIAELITRTSKFNSTEVEVQVCDSTDLYNQRHLKLFAVGGTGIDLFRKTLAAGA